MIDTTDKTITKTRTIVMNGDDIVGLLKRLDPSIKQAVHAEVTFVVPTGGDHSGDSIEIDDDHPITVVLIYREVKR